MRNRRIAAGLTLVLVGLALYAVQSWEGLGFSTPLLLIGTIFLASYFYSKNYGLLIPACILLGIGGGLLAEETTRSDVAWVQVGIGAGFIAIYVIGLLYQRQTQWWPLIPGGAMLLLGFPYSERIFEALFDNWPLLVVFVGLAILGRALFTRRDDDESRQATPATRDAPERTDGND